MTTLLLDIGNSRLKWTLAEDADDDEPPRQVPSNSEGDVHDEDDDHDDEDDLKAILRGCDRCEGDDADDAGDGHDHRKSRAGYI